MPFNIASLNSLLAEVEDLYRPFKEKKKTKATEAIKNGFENATNNNTSHVENVTSEMTNKNSSDDGVDFDYDKDRIDFNDNYTGKVDNKLKDVKKIFKLLQAP